MCQFCKKEITKKEKQESPIGGALCSECLQEMEAGQRECAAKEVRSRSRGEWAPEG